MNSRAILKVKRNLLLLMILGALAIYNAPVIGPLSIAWLNEHPTLAPLLPAATFFALNATLLWTAQKLMQREVNGVIESIDRQQLSNEAIFLYLRSFDVGRSSLLSRFAHGLTPWFWSQRYKRYDPEEELSTVLSSSGWLLAIGDKRVSYGAAKIKVADDKWQERFHQLIGRSRAIFMMPGPSEATMWEVARILESETYSRKAVFIMPREGTVDLMGSDGERREWEAAVDYISRSCGVALPSYSSDGAYVRVFADGTIETASLEAFTGALSLKGWGWRKKEVDLDRAWRSASPTKYVGRTLQQECC